MGAKQRFGFDIKRFFKRADQLARREDGVGDGTGRFGIGPEVAFALFRGGEQRRVAREVEKDIAGGLAAASTWVVQSAECTLEQASPVAASIPAGSRL